MRYFLWSLIILMVVGLPLLGVVTGSLDRRRQYRALRRQARADLARIRGGR